MATDHSRAFRRFTRAVFAAQAAVLRHGDTANAPLGQGSARWRVLRAIDDGHTSVADAARFMGSSRQSAQRLADTLIDEGLVEAAGQDDNRRLKRLRLTAEGQRVHDALEETSTPGPTGCSPRSGPMTSRPCRKDSSRSPTSSTPTVNTC